MSSSSDTAAQMNSLSTLRDAHTHAPDVADDEQDLVYVVDAAVSRVCGARGMCYENKHVERFFSPAGSTKPSREPHPSVTILPHGRST